MQWIVVSLLGGVLGKVLHPGDDGNGLFKTIGLGVLGGWVGNLISWATLGSTMTGIDLKSVGIAGVGSTIVLFIRRALQKKKGQAS